MNKIQKMKRLFWCMMPLGVIIWYFKRFGSFDETLNGTKGWVRVFNSSNMPGAEVLIRKGGLYE